MSTARDLFQFSSNNSGKVSDSLALSKVLDEDSTAGLLGFMDFLANSAALMQMI